MKAFSFVRSTLLRFAVAALVLIAACAAFVSASSLPKSGQTGNALALRVMMHPGAARSAWAHYLQAQRTSHLPNGRYLQEYPEADGSSRRAFAITNANPILEDEGVQTFDVFAPPPSFAVQPTLPLNATNLTPIWSLDESYIVFSSNLGGDGHFHLYGVSATGDTPAAGSTTPAIFQITSGSGNEFYPAFNATDSALAFTSDANSTGNQQLYVIGGQSGVPFVPGQAAINVTTLAANTGSAKTLGDNGFANVTHPTWDPGGDALAFSATTSTGANIGKTHIYFLFTSSNGYQETQGIGSTNPPAQLTDGPANDADPAWSPGTTGTDYIAFDSTATSVTSTGNGYGPGVTPSVTAGSNATRGLFLINGLGAGAPGAVPAGLNANNRIDATGSDDFGPAWSFPTQNQYTNPTGDLEYLCFARATAANASHGVYFFPLLQRTGTGAVATTFSPETATGGTNAAVHVNTDDPAGTFNDVYPTFAPFRSIFSIVYQSGSAVVTGGVPVVTGGRSITYNLASNIPEETPTSIPDGTTENGVPVGATYSGIFESQVLNLDPPTLLRYSGSEVVHVQNTSGATTKYVQPGTAATFVVRLSNREAGIDNTNGPNGGPNVYLQIKNPNSKYQGQDGLEHKVFANNNDIDLATGANLNSGSSARLFDGGVGAYTFGPTFGGYNFINNAYFLQYGSVGGTDGTVTIAVGHTSAVPSGDPPASADLSTYRPWGPEYECQYLDPQFASAGAGGNVDASATDYGVPYYLAGFDDQNAFSGLGHPPRPVVNTAAQPAVPASGTTPAQPAQPAKPAEWLQLTPLPAAQQDGQGGVLYSATFTTPTTPSDFYVDVIAYDNAVFPALPAADSNYVGLSKNWRIYDNVGGFTSQTFSGDNDILIVSDYALGQKFAATTFGGRSGNANLQPTFYGAESYYTDVDEALLPNATDFYSSPNSPVVPPIPVQANTATPTQVTATPGSSMVTVEWAGNFSPSYNVYRTTVPNPVFPANYVNIGQVAGMTSGTAQTSFLDSPLTNGVTYTYVITSVSANNKESGPSFPPVSVTPANFGNIVHSTELLNLNGGSGSSAGSTNPSVPSRDRYPNVQNGLGVGSYDDNLIDDGGTVTTTGDNLPSGAAKVPYVQSQKYSIWRVLSRGPVPTAVLAGYEPSFTSQPAVADVVNGVTAPAGANIPIANRCVIWVSPYTGNLPLVDSGSLENPTTQQTLQTYVNAGGRLCITGQNVASALSVKGSTANTFLTKTLGASFASQAGGSQILAGAGDRITGNSGFNGQVGEGSIAIPSGVGISVPSANALLLGSNIDSTPNWRTDGSLDMLGPNPTPAFSNGGSNNAVAQINTITPTEGMTDITTGGAAGLIYHEDYTDALGAGYGSRIVFGSFGLEGIGIEYFKFTGTDNVMHYAPVNQRPKILHNIVCYLRTGSFTGRITQASGAGVPGATVYLRPNGGTIPGPRQLFSGTTGFDGSYTISGVEPGGYSVVAYAQGFTTTVSNQAFGVEGDATQLVNLTIAPTPPGAITGVVTDSVTKVGIPGVTVTFKSVNGQTTVSGVTTPAGGGLVAGSYSIANVPAGPYNGTASLLPAYATATAPTEGNPITVPSGGTATANFTLTSKPATVSGTVFSDLNGNGTQDAGEPGVVGATVTLVPTATGGVTPAAVKTGAGGTYTVTGVATGTYTITVVANGFVTSASRTVTVTAGATITGENIPLVVAPPTQPGTLGGLVTDAVSGSAIAGATVTLTTSAGAAVTDLAGNTVAPATTTGTTSSPTAPTGDGSPLNYSFTNLPAGTYTVTVTDSGYGTQKLPSLTVTAGAFTRADFTAANGNPLEPIHVFPGGQFSFFSLPTDYSGGGVAFVNSLFGPLNLGTFSPLDLNPANANRSHLYVYDPTLLQYITDPTPPADGLHIGQGYWVYLVKASELTSVGTSPTTATVPVALARGWNMIGVPSTSAISVSRLTFANATGGGAVSFSDATGSAYHLILPTLYGFDGTEYNTVTATSSLQPYQAYWIYAYAATTVLIPTTGG